MLTLIASLAVCALLGAAAGLAGGIYLASRFEWPGEMYDRLFGGGR